MGFRAWLSVLTLLALSCVAPHAFSAPPRTSNEQVWVLTFGPGDHPFSKFGHNAVAVVDPLTGRGLAYNFGTFSFDSPTLISDFLKGKLRYWVSVTPLGSTLDAYRRADREIVAQELALTPSERRLLIAKLRWHALPENKFYRYDYYLDNCSTKVRDVLDETLGGALSEQAKAPAHLTWRQHTSRLTEGSTGVFLGLNAALADGVDQHATRWEEMFLPSVLSEELAGLERGGSNVVRSTKVLHQSARPAPRATPSSWLLPLLALGAALGAGWLALARARTRPLAYVQWVIQSSWCLALGLLGGVFWMFWLYTDHQIAHGNENIWLCPVWMLAMPVLGWARLRGRAWGARAAHWCTLAAAASASLGLAAKVLPTSDQDNWMFIALTMPVWLAMAWTELGRRTERVSLTTATPREKAKSEATAGLVAVE